MYLGEPLETSKGSPKYIRLKLAMSSLIDSQESLKSFWLYLIKSALMKFRENQTKGFLKSLKLAMSSLYLIYLIM